MAFNLQILNKENSLLKARDSQFKKGTAFIGLGPLLKWQRNKLNIYSNELFLVLDESWHPEDEPDAVEHDGPIPLTLLEIPLGGKNFFPRVIKVHPENDIYVEQFVDADISIKLKALHA